MDWWLLTFFLGAILSLFLPIVPAFFYVLMIIIITVILFTHSDSRKVVGLLLGAAWLLFHGAQYQHIWHNNDLNLNNVINRTVQVRGEIANIPNDQNNAQRFNFSVSHINGQPLPHHIGVRLTWKTLEHQPKQGQLWLLNIKMKPAHGLANTGSFSYQTWLRKNHIHATGYVKNSSNNALLNASSSFRQRQYDHLQATLASIEANSLAPLVTALTFGEKSLLTDQHWRVLQATATQHLMAISGLHLGLIAGGSYFFAIFVLKILPFTSLTTANIYPILTSNNRILAIIFSFIVTWIYAYYAGFSVPTIRALLMLSFIWGAKLLTVKLSLVRLILLVVFSIIMVSPFSVFSSSFWLSFYAVSIILIVYWRFKPILVSPSSSRLLVFLSRCKSLFIIQLSLTVLMLPITVFLNYSLSLSAMLANIIAVPFMSVTAIPLSLLAVLFLPINAEISQLILELAHASLSLLWQWLSYLSTLDNLMLTLSQLQLAAIIFAVLMLWVVVFVGLSKPYSTVLYGLVLLVGLVGCCGYFFMWSTKQFAPEQWQVRVMDVGQGLAVFIEVNGEIVLYDTGASYPSGFNMAESVLLPYLRYKGYKQLDGLIISHDDNDHAGGLGILAEQIPIARIIYNDANSQPLLSTEPCLQGQTIHWHFLTIEQLWPQQVKAQHNDDSCVVKISDGNNSVLLTGDISASIEKKLVAKYHQSSENKLQARVLIAPHHGSKSSSSATFIDAVQPDAVVFSAGFLNRWQMPVPSVVKRYNNYQVKTYNTATDGMVTVEFSQQGAHIVKYRQSVWPFWFAN